MEDTISGEEVLERERQYAQHAPVREEAPAPEPVTHLTTIELKLEPTVRIFWHGHGTGVRLAAGDPIVKVGTQFYRGEVVNEAVDASELSAYLMLLFNEKAPDATVRRCVLTQLKFRFSSLLFELEFINDVSSVSRCDQIFLAAQIATFLMAEEVRSNTYERLQNGHIVIVENGED